MESYDGMAVVRTVDPEKALIEIQISPGCESLVADLLHHLGSQEEVRIAEQNEISEPRPG